MMTAAISTRNIPQPDNGTFMWVLAAQSLLLLSALLVRWMNFCYITRYTTHHSTVEGPDPDPDEEDITRELRHNWDNVMSS
jgi:hypothetical protein